MIEDYLTYLYSKESVPKGRRITSTILECHSIRVELVLQRPIAGTVGPAAQVRVLDAEQALNLAWLRCTGCHRSRSGDCTCRIRDHWIVDKCFWSSWSSWSSCTRRSSSICRTTVAGQRCCRDQRRDWSSNCHSKSKRCCVNDCARLIDLICRSNIIVRKCVSLAVIRIFVNELAVVVVDIVTVTETCGLFRLHIAALSQKLVIASSDERYAGRTGRRNVPRLNAAHSIGTAIVTP